MERCTGPDDLGPVAGFVCALQVVACEPSIHHDPPFEGPPRPLNPERILIHGDQHPLLPLEPRRLDIHVRQDEIPGSPRVPTAGQLQWRIGRSEGFGDRE
ncbi:MAG: hypothetical protein ABR593_05800 [Candidatus Limnocylindria bacterium]